MERTLIAEYSTADPQRGAERGGCLVLAYAGVKMGSASRIANPGLD